MIKTKKAFVIPIGLVLCFMFCVNVFATSTYIITDRQTLQNFETGDPIAENIGGNTGWGGHWIETTLTAADGLEGKVALRLDFGESDTGTIGGVHADNIGTTNDEDDWTPGQALLYRIKNLSDSSINVATTIDVADENSAGRARIWQDGVQILLNTSYAPVETIYADAIANDGVTTADRKLYVTIPAGFDGYLLWDLSKYVGDVEQHFEAIPPDTTVNPNWRTAVKHIVPLFQDCQNKSVIIDDFRLVDYELIEVVEDVVPEESESALQDTQDSPAPTAPLEVPQTGDKGISAFALCIIIVAAALMFRKLYNAKIN